MAELFGFTGGHERPMWKTSMVRTGLNFMRTPSFSVSTVVGSETVII
jgi:hypothetical protein